jgi:hypothetical protein
MSRRLWTVVRILEQRVEVTAESAEEAVDEARDWADWELDEIEVEVAAYRTGGPAVPYAGDDE